jgi:hypothetical protein
MTSLREKQLIAHLGKYEERDEFQIGRMLVNVMHDQSDDRNVTLDRAEQQLDALLRAMPDVLVLAGNALGFDCDAQCFGLWIYGDGSADYHCGSFGVGSTEGTTTIHRDADGALRIKISRSQA